MYLWEADRTGLRFADALLDAHRRGCRVRVLVDGWGASEVIPSLRQLADAGIDVRVYNPIRVRVLRFLFHRTHKKLLIVDGEQAFTGGAGFSEHFSGFKRNERPWHDRMYRIEGPAVAQLATVFASDLSRWRSIGEPRVGPHERGIVDHPRTGDAVLRVLRGWPDSPDYAKTLLRAVREAESHVLLGTPYFIPPRRLRRALHHALARGIDVRIVVPALDGASPLTWFAARRHYGGILRRGGRVFEFGPRFYHAKIAVVDDRVALFGSSNLDGWSWRRNAELDLLTKDEGSARQLRACFDEDCSGATEITFEEHRSRSRGQRLIEALAGLYERLL